MYTDATTIHYEQIKDQKRQIVQKNKQQLKMWSDNLTRMYDTYDSA